MNWKGAVNRRLERTLGVRLVRAGGHASGDGSAAAPGPPKPAAPPRPKVDRAAKDLVRPAAHPETDRLLKSPVFVMSTVRSGSTLLRVLLNAHSQIHAPHELHIRRLRVKLSTSMAAKSMRLLGLNEADLEHLLWDRVLQRELQLSGKDLLVDKTPSNTFDYDRLSTVWPDARFIFLIRHPASIAESWIEVTSHKNSRRDAITDVLRYIRSLDKARAHLSGLTVRYEDLTSDPATVTRQICEFLGLPWEEGMLDYGGAEKFVKGVGDWSPAIRSGSVQPGRALPQVEDIPPRLRAVCRRWGYLPDVAPDADELAATAEDPPSEDDLPSDDESTDEEMESATQKS